MGLPQGREELKQQTDAAHARLTAQLAGLEPYMERSDAPGEWTTREVLSHLLLETGSDAVALLKTFARDALPLVDVDAGKTYVDDARRRMSLREFAQALDTQRRAVIAYLDSLPEADLTQRKARIPLFKAIMGTDEIPIATFVGAMFGYHWNDHARQLAKIRRAVGLPDAK